MTQTNQTSAQMNIWKKNLLDKKAEKDAEEARIKKMMESGEMYNNMVSEAVGFITARVTQDTQSSYMLHEEKDGIVIISIYGALVITPDLHLHSASLSVPTNPKTGKQYFFDFNQFKDEEEVQRFFEDVKSRLPQGVTFREHMAHQGELASLGSRVYDARVEISLYC